MQMLAILLLSLLQSVACLQHVRNQEIAAHDNLKALEVKGTRKFWRDSDGKSTPKFWKWGFKKAVPAQVDVEQKKVPGKVLQPKPADPQQGVLTENHYYEGGEPQQGVLTKNHYYFEGAESEHEDDQSDDDDDEVDSPRDMKAVFEQLEKNQGNQVPRDMDKFEQLGSAAERSSVVTDGELKDKLAKWKNAADSGTAAAHQD